MHGQVQFVVLEVSLGMSLNTLVNSLNTRANVVELTGVC
jgi:hypothetical protein